MTTFRQNLFAIVIFIVLLTGSIFLLAIERYPWCCKYKALDIENEGAFELVNSYPKESELAEDPPITDLERVTTATESKVILINSSNIFHVGDTVAVQIVVYDGRGERRRKGGDIIRIKLNGDPGLSAMIGTVIDNEDGTYTGRIKMFFPGEFSSVSFLAYSREAVRTFYHMRRQGSNNHVLHGRFSSDNVTEITPCSPISTDLGSEPLCNLTQENYGLPWYCVRPKNYNLVCLDWICTVEKGYTVPLQDKENDVIKWKMLWQKIPSSVSITVLEDGFTEPELPNCRDIPKHVLWNQASPIGYMRKGVWSNVLCKADRDMKRYIRCLNGKELVVLGDSTSRTVVSNLLQSIGGDLVSSWPKNPWHKPIMIQNSEYNYTITWKSHSVPFFTGMQTRRYNRAIAASLADIGDEDDVIVLISYHMHLLAFHHSVFEERLILLRRAIELFLDRNRRAVVLLQGMAVWSEEYFLPLFPDCFVDLFADITRRVFSGISDRVIYLNHRDITFLGDNTEMHPEWDLQEEMNLNMFGFIC